MPFDLACVVCVGRGLIGGEAVRGEDLDDLVLFGKGGFEMLRRREVAGAALLPRERLVGDVANEVLEEPVMAVLGRARIRLDGEDLLADQRLEERLELVLGSSGDRRQAPRA